ncbi:MAG: lipoate--protein ligase family protein [Hyphomicrobiales bacterium]|nr:lipoate--protein ligase family protein [Hyphomicrobiales bacterium]
MGKFRVIDTGVRGGRANIAFDSALIEAHEAGEIPDTIRFLTFRPSALVGRHQSLSRELKLDWCRENGVETVRRITGGGALYMDEGQFGLELIFHRKSLDLPTLADVAKGICESIALGLSKFGIPARYRPRNDIEVDGRKISGTGGFFSGDTLFYQATILADMDAARMLSALNVPEAKLAKRALDDAGSRVTTLKALLGPAAPSTGAIREALLEGLGERLGLAPEWGTVTAREEDLARRLHDEEIGTDDFVAEIDSPPEGSGHAARHGAGGTIEAWVRREGAADDRIREVLITGDFFVTPPRTVLDLEAALRGVAVGEIRERIESFFREAKVGALSTSASDFADVVEEAARAI